MPAPLPEKKLQQQTDQSGLTKTQILAKDAASTLAAQSGRSGAPTTGTWYQVGGKMLSAADYKAQQQAAADKGNADYLAWVKSGSKGQSPAEQAQAQRDKLAQRPGRVGIGVATQEDRAAARLANQQTSADLQAAKLANPTKYALARSQATSEFNRFRPQNQQQRLSSQAQQALMQSILRKFKGFK